MHLLIRFSHSNTHTHTYLIEWSKKTTHRTLSIRNSEIFANETRHDSVIFFVWIAGIFAADTIQAHQLSVLIQKCYSNRVLGIFFASVHASLIKKNALDYYDGCVGVLF